MWKLTVGSRPALPGSKPAAVSGRRSGSSLQPAPALGGYLLLTLVLTYPMLVEFGRAIPGDSFDGWQNVWNLWWIKTALLEQHVSPFFTDLLYYPTGVSLLFHTLNPFNGFVTLPVQLAWALIPAYNAAVLMGFVLGGFGAYLLARQVLGTGPQTRWPAFVAGAIFTFAPVHIAHLLGHLQVLSLEWIPFFALYLIRLTAPPRPGLRSRRRTLSNAGLAALFLALVALCDWYFVLYCAFLTAVVYVWVLARIVWKSRVRRAQERGIAAALWGIPLAWALFALALSPLLLPMVGEARASRFMVPDAAQSATLSADLLAFVTPQEFHPLWGRWAQERAAVFTASASERQVFAGYTALVLAGLGLWAGLRRRARRVATGLWLLGLVVFTLLALGPVLHVNGRTALLPGGGSVALPYGWLVAVIPFMDITRSVSRYDIMVMLVIAVLAAQGLHWLMRAGGRAESGKVGTGRRGRGRMDRKGRMVAVAALAFVTFEFLPAPYPHSPPDTPEWYKTLAADERPGAVLNLPMNWDRPGYLLYQTVHHKPLAVAYISRDDPRTLTERNPLLQQLRRGGVDADVDVDVDVIDFDPEQAGQAALARLGVRWMVLDRYKMPGAAERAFNEKMAQKIFAGQAPVYEDERLTAYELAEAVPQAAFIELGIGWSALDVATHTRSFDESAPVIIQAPAAGSFILSVTTAPGSAPLALEAAGVNAEGGKIYESRLDLSAGQTELALRSLVPGSDSRVEVSQLRLTAAP